MKRHVALLRAINLAGRNRIRMADLRQLCEELGWSDVRTHLQSGNVLFEASGTRQVLERQLTEGIRERFGLDITVMVRTPQELQEALDRNPYSSEDPTRVLLGFFDKAPTGTLEAPPGDDRFTIAGDVLYLDLPHGAGRTKLGNAFFEKKLGCRVTTRNLRVVQALAR